MLKNAAEQSPGCDLLLLQEAPEISCISVSAARKGKAKNSIHTRDGRGEVTVNLVFRTTGTELEAVVRNSHSTRIINHCTRRKTSAICRAKSKMSSEEPLLGDSAMAHEQRKMKLLMIAQ